ncbi:hypothetical protein F4814DRAFT_435631 [Daldinia grandis]|nr:hypothetical protein F4814DRAFT_435631 [Daldinia grandis]
MALYKWTTTVRGPAPASKGRPRVPGSVEHAALVSLLTSAAAVCLASSWYYGRVVRWFDTI